jgi:iron complex transport system substrate-binding protein
MKERTFVPIIAVLALIVIAAACAGCAGTTEQKSTVQPGTDAAPVSTALSARPPVPSVPSGTGITITQTDGKQVTLEKRPSRIIVTNSDAAEMLIALNAADTIVGITESTKNVSHVMRQIPAAESIGDWQTPNVEKMLSLNPDVVISYASSKPKNIDQILAANITIVYLDCYRLPKLAQDARAVGVLTGNTQKAEEYATMVENLTALVMRRVAAVPRDELPSVYFEGYSDYTAAGTGSGSDELLVMAGGKNAVATFSTSSSPKVSAEWVVSTNPDYVMKVIPAKETRPFSEIADVLKKRTGWDTMKAVQQNRIYLFASGIEYGPKAYIGLAETAKVLHPDLFADLDPEGMLDRYAGVYVPGTNGTTMMYP